MCELFGFSAASDITANPFLQTLMTHSVDHPHGWGIAAFYGNAVSLEKEPRPALLSDYLGSRLRQPLRAANLIAHIRLATRGDIVYENCHPFVDRDKWGRAWSLAHNGTIFHSDLLEQYRDIQQGETDSERILCHVIRRINSLENPSPEQRFAVLDNIVHEIAEGNKLNLLLYDGELLYVHTNMPQTLFRSGREGMTFFATVPLDEGEWEPVPMMQMLAYQDGQLVYEGTPHSYIFSRHDPDQDASFWAGL